MTQYDLDLREYWRIIKKRRWIIIVTLILTGLFSTVFALINRPVPVYKATATVKLDQIIQSGSQGMYQESVPWTSQDMLTTQASIVKSYPIIEMAAKRMSLIPQNLSSEEVRFNKDHLGVVLSLKNMVDSDIEPQIGMINIIVKSEDPRLAERLANAVAQAYREARISEVNRRSINQKSFVENQLNQAREKLKVAEEAVKDYREKNMLVSQDGDAGGLIGKLQTAQAAYERAQANLQKAISVRATIERAESSPLGSKTSFYLEDAPSVYRTFNDKLVQLMFERDTLLNTYTELYPQVAEIRKQIREVIVTMQGQLAAYEARLREDIRQSGSQVSEISKKIEMVPMKRLELIRLERQVFINTETYAMLERKLKEVSIQEADRIETVQIVKPALEPTEPMNPPKVKETALAGLLIGLILGIALAFLAEIFDTSLGAVEEIESLLGVPVLGLIPHVSPQEIKETLKEKYAGEADPEIADRVSRLVSHFAPKSRLAESYRALRTNLAFAGLERDVKTIVLTSSSPEEGKTTSIVNLAITMAQGGNRVLLIEGDLRKPMISKMFGLDYAPGLSDVLLGSNEWRRVVKTIADIMTGKLSTDEILQTPGIENLHILSSGTIPPNPAELIYSKAIGDLIGQVRAEYDYVLIDAPPLLAATDAALLAARADAVVLVYRVGKVPRGVLKRAKAQLENVKAKVIGVILNGLKAELSTDFAEYKYKYYYYQRSDDTPQTPADKLRSLPDLVRAHVEQARKRVSLGKLAELKRAVTNRKPAGALRDPLPARSSEPVSPQDKKGSLFKTGLVLFAAVCLLMGILYQMGVLKLTVPAAPVQTSAQRGSSMRAGKRCGTPSGGTRFGISHSKGAGIKSPASAHPFPEEAKPLS
ncbi:MAG TPA: polysaccharide biosynthesis tyrosine autokinase [Syntrophales bacterium]|nr:polysaccharide biosynthesis tyrosine autokinase [Syntrophales bacterium]